MAQDPKAEDKSAASGWWDIIKDTTPWGTELDTSASPSGMPRTRPAPSPGWWNAAKNTTLNLLDPRQAGRQFTKTIGSIPGFFNGDAMKAIINAGIGAKMEWRRRQGLKITPEWLRGELPVTSRNSYNDKQLQQMAHQAYLTWNDLANDFSYVDPKTGQRHLDLTELGHKMMTNPRDVVTMLAGAGELGASKRLGYLTKAGRLGEGADIISNTGKLASRIQKGSRVAATVADPFSTLAIKGGSKAIARGLDIASRTRNNPVTSILNPDFVSAFEDFKQNALEDLIDGGMKPSDARRQINQNRDSLFYQFNEQTGGQFRNPYNAETTRMFEAQGKNPEAYGAPSIYDRLNQRFNRTGGPSEAAVRHVAFESAQIPNPRRGITTQQPPHPALAQNEKNWIANQQQTLSTQLNDRMSGKYPGQQFDYDALAAHNPNPVAGSQINGYTYDPSAGWQSPSGIRAGDVLQPYLTDQYRVQNAAPGGVNLADLDFIHRNRAASRDLSQIDSATVVPQTNPVDRAIHFAKNIASPILSAGSMYLYSQNPTWALAAGTAGAGKQIFDAGRFAKNYLNEVRGHPFTYDPNSALLKNDFAIPRVAARVPSLITPDMPEQQAQPQVQISKPTPKPVAVPYSDVFTAPLPVPVPEQTALPSGLPSSGGTQELTPHAYDLSGYPDFGNSTEQQPQNRGGRIAYKKGGAVNPTIEHLVQGLMSRYKTVKKSQDNGTKPLLEQPDQAIVKALSVAQKAI